MNNAKFYQRPGQGLNWDEIRREYEKTATPAELNGPFDENGNLKGRKARELREEEVEKQETANARARASRAKPKPKSRQEAGAMARTTNKLSPEERGSIISLYKEGVPMNKIGRMLGRNGVTVRGVLIQEGVHVPKDTSGKAGSES